MYILQPKSRKLTHFSTQNNLHEIVEIVDFDSVSDNRVDVEESRVHDVREHEDESLMFVDDKLQLGLGLRQSFHENRSGTENFFKREE